MDRRHAESARVDVQLDGFGSTGTVMRRTRARPAAGGRPAPLGTLRLQVPGRHSVLNALAAVPSGSSWTCRSRASPQRSPSSRAPSGASSARGVVNGITVVDDYGHHPTEIAAVLAAARAAGPARVVVAFQPHRYSRTAQLMRRVRRRAGRRRRGRAHRHLPRRRGTDSRRHVEALAAAVNRRRAGAGVDRRAAARRVAAAVAALARARRPGDHPGRRLDRRRRGAGGAGIERRYGVEAAR